jgi:hypothetical protein
MLPNCFNQLLILHENSICSSGYLNPCDQADCFYWSHILMCRAAKSKNRTDFDSIATNASRFLPRAARSESAPIENVCSIRAPCAARGARRARARIYRARDALESNTYIFYGSGPTAPFPMTKLMTDQRRPSPLESYTHPPPLPF